MATRDQLYTALKQADAAGDHEGAAKLAAYIRTLPAEGLSPRVAVPNESTEPPAPPPKTDDQRTKAMLDKAADAATDATVGGAEDLGHVVTGALASIPSGLAGLGAAGVNTVTDALGKPRLLPSAGDTVDKVGGYLTYQPQTASGKAGAALVTKPMEALAKGGDIAGQKVLDVTGSPEAATLTSTGIQALPMLLDPALRGVSRAMDAPSALERSAQGSEAPAPIDVKHAVVDNQHVVSSPNGTTTAMPRGANIQIIDTQTNPAAQGAGEGTARAAKLADLAHAQGGKLVSDTKVSPSAAKVYDKLEAQGYPVTRNTVSPDEEGHLVSQDSRPAFEVGPKPVEPIVGSPAGIPTAPQATKVTREMTPEEAHQAAVQTLLEHDVPLSTGQRGTDFAARQAASAGRAADTVLGPDKLTDRQGQAFTKAVLKKVGVDASRATPDAMQELQGKTNAEYNDILAKSPTRVTKPMVDKLLETKQQILGEVDPTAASPLIQQIDGIAAKIQAGPDAFIDGRSAQNSRAALGRLQQSPNPSVKHWAGELKNQLDDAFEASADPVDAARMKAVRAVVQKTKQFEGAVDGQGIISPNKLYSNLTRKNERGQFLYGGGDQSLVDLAKAGKQVLPDKVGNSGTATRGVDVAKILEIIRHPVRATVEGSAAAAGRLNSVNATRGTASAVRQAQTISYLRDQLGNEAQPLSVPKINALVAGSSYAPNATVSAPLLQQDTPEQQRARLVAQALRTQ